MIVLHIILYGVIAGASALAAAAVVIVLRSEHSRLHGIAFAVGLVAAQFLVTVVAMGFGDVTLPQTRTGHLIVEGILQVLLGVALLVGAQRLRHPKEKEKPEPVLPRQEGPWAAKLRARQTAMLDRIGALDTGPVVGAGALLGIGPKRLVLTVLAAATISTAKISRTGETTLVGLYVALATVLVWGPVLAAIVLGRRAGDWTAKVQEWWKAHRAVAILVPVLVFGVYFVASGILDLLNA